MQIIVAVSLLIVATLGIGFLSGWFCGERVRRKKVDGARTAADDIITRAETEAAALKKTADLEARDEWRREREPLERETERKRNALRDLESGLSEREQQLDRKVDVLESKERSLVKNEEELTGREQQIGADETRVDEMVREQRDRLEELGGMTRAEALKMLVQEQEKSAQQLAARRVREIKDNAIANANREAKEIISSCIERFAGDLTLESTVSVVSLPNDEMKGRIIGRDGRNIRSFDMITGVEVIVDDSPGMVMLSSFDPLRREVAKNTLEKLITDGRIHPGRIEEVYEKAKEDVEEIVRESASKAAFDLGIHDLPGPLLELLGRLRFRTSYGQSLLTHSMEVGSLAGMIAEALDLDAGLARRAGLLHDIGRALDHEIGTDTAQMGAAIARKSDEAPEVIEVIETHNLNIPVRSTLATVVKAADEISTGRPGARKEKVEEYIRRMDEIEAMATARPGVNRAYALQNGKEIRILVDSAMVDDAYAEQLAEEITQSIETELGQAGQIKVCVIREVRAVQYAR